MYSLENFTIETVDWNPDGRSLILMDKSKFCVAFPLDEGQEEVEVDRMGNSLEDISEKVDGLTV